MGAISVDKLTAQDGGQISRPIRSCSMDGNAGRLVDAQCRGELGEFSRNELGVCAPVISRSCDALELSHPDAVQFGPRINDVLLLKDFDGDGRFSAADFAKSNEEFDRVLENLKVGESISGLELAAGGWKAVRCFRVQQNSTQPPKIDLMVSGMADPQKSMGWTACAVKDRNRDLVKETLACIEMTEIGPMAVIDRPKSLVDIQVVDARKKKGEPKGESFPDPSFSEEKDPADWLFAGPRHKTPKDPLQKPKAEKPSLSPETPGISTPPLEGWGFRN